MDSRQRAIVGAVAMLAGAMASCRTTSSIPAGAAERSEAWTNSLGMIFRPVPGTACVFSVWETRVRDFQTFVEDRGNNGGYDYASGQEPYIWGGHGWGNGEWGFSWRNPAFDQTLDDPVTCVSVEDAMFFCAWLTRREHASKVLPTDRCYRLPTDAEWSVAVGLKEEPTPHPFDLSRKTPGVYLWGEGWPPPPGAGNYAGEEASITGAAPVMAIVGYRDAFARTAPVGSFASGRHGLCDLGGNVDEWCTILPGTRDDPGIRRGRSWFESSIVHLHGAWRLGAPDGRRSSQVGFRCVIAPLLP